MHTFFVFRVRLLLQSSKFSNIFIFSGRWLDICKYGDIFFFKAINVYGGYKRDSVMARVRLKDIAEKANMSVYTVSSALSGRGQICQAKRDAVRRIAAEMGYQPNIVGRLLQARKNRDMGLLLLGSPDELRRNVGFMDFNFHFMQLCKKMGIRHQTEWFSPQEQPDELPGLLTEGLVGGVIIAGEPYGAVRDHLAGGNALPNVRLDGNDGYCVCFDWENALNRSVHSLFQLGHRRIAMLNGFEHYQVYQDARKGYLQGLAETGLPAGRELYWAPTSEFLLTERVLHGMEYLFEQENPPTAVLAGGGLLVKSVVSWLQQKGYRVPLDVSVAAFGAANWEALNFIPVLSAVEYDYELAAEECVRLLDLLMNNGNENKPERVLIRLGGLTLRESTAPRSGSAKAEKGIS